MQDTYQEYDDNHTSGGRGVPSAPVGRAQKMLAQQAADHKMKPSAQRFAQQFLQEAAGWELDTLSTRELAVLHDRLESLQKDIEQLEGLVKGGSGKTSNGYRRSARRLSDPLFPSEFKEEVGAVKEQVATQMETQGWSTDGGRPSVTRVASLLTRRGKSASWDEGRGAGKSSGAGKRRVQRTGSVGSVGSTGSTSSAGSRRSAASGRGRRGGGGGKISRKNGNMEVDEGGVSVTSGVRRKSQSKSGGGTGAGGSLCTNNHPDRCCACGNRIYIKGRSHWRHECDCSHNFHLKCVSKADFAFSTTVCHSCGKHAPLYKVVRPTVSAGAGSAGGASGGVGSGGVGSAERRIEELSAMGGQK